MAITKLVAGAKGDPSNSTGLQVATSVNELIDESVQQATQISSLQSGKASVSHSHSSASTSTPGFLSATDKQKLDSIAFGATVNSQDFILLDRTSHTGVQPISTVSGLQAALDDKALVSHTHAIATALINGFMSASDKIKLDSVSTGATANSSDATLLNRANHTGTQATSTITNLDSILAQKAEGTHTHSVATTLANGFISASDKIKLDSVSTGATANSSDATLLNRANHTGTQPLSSVDSLVDSLAGKSNVDHLHAVATTSTDGFLSSTDKIKLNSVAANASANSTDTFLLFRGNHTGSQGIGTITGLEAELSSKQPMLTPGTDLSIDPVTWTISYIGTGSGGSGTNDHNALINRNVANQHTIGAITGLQGELDTKSPIGHTHSDATTSISGFMSATDKVKLDGIATGATVNSSDATLLNRANHTGTQAISTIDSLQSTLDAKSSNVHSHTPATTSKSGFMSFTDKVKLDDIAAGATANSSDATLLNRANHTGTQAISTIDNLENSLANKASEIHNHMPATTVLNGFMSAIDKVKLDGIATGATANSSNATLLNRANHTGTQAISTVTNLQLILDDNFDSLSNEINTLSQSLSTVRVFALIGMTR